jgi:hypothetical protein
MLEQSLAHVANVIVNKTFQLIVFMLHHIGSSDIVSLLDSAAECLFPIVAVLVFAIVDSTMRRVLRSDHPAGKNKSL